MEILEIIKASQGIAGETRRCSINDVGPLRCLRTCLRVPSIVVVGSRVEKSGCKDVN
jgi:hypothetical protein